MHTALISQGNILQLQLHVLPLVTTTESKTAIVKSQQVPLTKISNNNIYNVLILLYIY